MLKLRYIVGDFLCEWHTKIILELEKKYFDKMKYVIDRLFKSSRNVFLINLRC